MKIADINFIQIEKHNLHIFKNLAQAYEAEFSTLTHKLPDESGLFKIDTLPLPPYVGYLMFEHRIPIGFCVAHIDDETNDIAEFYIVPMNRKKKFGYQLAAFMFDKYPGFWQVRQIEGATEAIHFWRSVIKKYTHNSYEEAIVKDSHWGIVTRQRFQTRVT